MVLLPIPCFWLHKTYPRKLHVSMYSPVTTIYKTIVSLGSCTHDIACELQLAQGFNEDGGS
jgi:hypothetical protein